METPRFITIFTTVRHLFQSWAISIQSTSSPPVSLRFAVTLSYQLWLGLLSGVFPVRFPIKTLYTCLFSPIRATCPAHHTLLDLITRLNIWFNFFIITNLIHKFLVHLHKLYHIKFLYMYRAQSAHHQEVNDANCTYAASGIVTLCKWLSCATAKEVLP